MKECWWFVGFFLSVQNKLAQQVHGKIPENNQTQQEAKTLH